MITIYPSAKRLSAACTWCAILIFAFYLLRNTDSASGAVTRALGLCVSNVIPSLFPFMVISSLVLSSGLSEYIGRLLSVPFGAIFAMNGNGAAALIIGLVAGFPVGAKTAAQSVQSGLCSREEGQRLCAFCNNTGPAFLIGGIGAGFFGDARVGIMLYLIELLSVFILGALLAIGKPRPAACARTVIRFRPDLPGAVRRAAESVLWVCGYVVFFSVMTEAVSAAIAPTPLAPCLAVIVPLLEVTGGSLFAARTGGSAGFILAAATIGWSGLCVHAQCAADLSDAGLSVGKYMLGKAAQSGICALLAAVCCLFS